MFKKATKEKSKLRAAFFGPPGAGKTFTALRVATGIASVDKGRIAVIDTEHGTASKYSDYFDFDTIDLKIKKIENYTELMNAAQSAGYKVLVIDSLSHAWQELVDEIEILAKAKYQGNTFRAWGEGTPKQRDFIDALLSFDGHVIATMRSKIDYTTDQNDKGRLQVKRVGLKPEQGKDIEYEFDFLLEINQEHYATVLKDRTGKYQDKNLEKPDEKFGAELAAWLGISETKTTETKPVESKPATAGERLKDDDKPAEKPETKPEAKAETKPAAKPVEAQSGDYVITGKTYDHRPAIKAAGGYWDKTKKAWIMSDADAHKIEALLNNPDNGLVVERVEPEHPF